MKIITGNDEITKIIDKKIKDIEKSYHTFIACRKQINDFFLEFYSNVENYTYDQLIIRKKYIEECEEDAGKVFKNYVRSSYISFLTILLTSFVYSIYYSMKQDLKLEDLLNIQSQLLTLYAQIGVFVLLFVIIIVLSYAAVFTGRKYRKYHTIQLEIDIIESIIKTRFKDSDLTKNIIDNISQNTSFSDRARGEQFKQQ